MSLGACISLSYKPSSWIAGSKCKCASAVLDNATPKRVYEFILPSAAYDNSDVPNSGQYLVLDFKIFSNLKGI